MRNSDYKAYHESVAIELLASRNRVRYFIGSSNWPEDGRFKEMLLMNYLKKNLPSNVSVGTGFVKNGEETTKQIDLIVYDNSIPTLFSEGDFVIVLPESVYGIIEVKSRITSGEMISGTISNANKNGEIIGMKIFNGVFGYETDISISNNRSLADSVKLGPIDKPGFVNHISFGANFFFLYWHDGNPDAGDGVKCFSFYEINNLSFGYFFSNLVEFIHLRSRNQLLSDTMSNFLYPISEGKETYRLRDLEVRFDVPIPRE